MDDKSKMSSTRCYSPVNLNQTLTGYSAIKKQHHINDLSGDFSRLQKDHEQLRIQNNNSQQSTRPKFARLRDANDFSNNASIRLNPLPLLGN